MKYYIAALLNADGNRHPVDRGGGSSENTAVRVAMRLANEEKHDACVVRVDEDGKEEIVQRIRFRNDVVMGEVTDTRACRYMSASLPLDDAALAFINGWLERGKSVTVTNGRWEKQVHIVASH